MLALAIGWLWLFPSMMGYPSFVAAINRVTKVGQTREQSTRGFAAVTTNVDRPLERYCCA